MGQFLAMVLNNQNSLWIHSFAKTNQQNLYWDKTWWSMVRKDTMGWKNVSQILVFACLFAFVRGGREGGELFVCPLRSSELETHFTKYCFVFFFLNLNCKEKLSKIMDFLSFGYLFMGSRREGHDKGTNLYHFSNVYKEFISMCRTSEHLTEMNDKGKRLVDM